MAGMLYLPRLFVYHCEAERGSKQSETFKVMEMRLLRLIINPAGITISAGSIRKVEGVVAMTTVQFFGTAANAPLATLTVDSTTGRVERLCEPS